MQGVKLFRKKPGEMFLFGNTYLFIILFVGILIPFLGAAAVAMASPALGFGIMLAGRMAQKGLRVGPSVLFNASLIVLSNGAFLRVLKYSRIRSKITTVSLIE